DDAAPHVLVDAGEPDRLDEQSGLSRTSRRSPSSIGSSSSRTPPGGCHWPVSRRWVTNTFPVSSSMTAATLTECRGVIATVTLLPPLPSRPVPRPHRRSAHRIDSAGAAPRRSVVHVGSSWPGL